MNYIIKSLFAGLLLLLLLTNTDAQKTEDIKYDGFYNNIAVTPLNVNGYRSKNITSPNVTTLMNSLNFKKLELKGYDSGDDLTLVFFCSEPIVSSSVKSKTVGMATIPVYYTNVTASALSKVVVLNKQGVVLYASSKQPYSFLWVDANGLSKPDQKSALLDLEKDTEYSSDDVKKKYIQETIRTYQIDLDNIFGKFARKETFKICTIKPKKFDYSDFNDATLAFQKATSTADINSPEASAAISESIKIWEDYASTFQNDKNAKVNEDNIDDINSNIALGYLVKGDGLNTKLNLDKCIEIKGKSFAESGGKKIINPMLENYQTAIVTKDKPQEIFTLISKDQAYNNMIVMAYLNQYLSSKNENLGILLDYFPANRSLLEVSNTVRTSSDGAVERINITYAPFGNINTINYTINGGISNSKTIDLQFIYSEYGVSKIVKVDNRSFIDFIYDETGKISEVSFLGVNSKETGQKITSLSPNEIEMSNFSNENGVKKSYKSPNTIKFDDKLCVTSINMYPYGTETLKYDSKNILSEIRTSNAGDEMITLKLQATTDEFGNNTKLLIDGLKDESTFQYLNK